MTVAAVKSVKSRAFSFSTTTFPSAPPFPRKSSLSNYPKLSTPSRRLHRLHRNDNLNFSRFRRNRCLVPWYYELTKGKGRANSITTFHAILPSLHLSNGVHLYTGVYTRSFSPIIARKYIVERWRRRGRPSKFRVQLEGFCTS